MTRPYDLRAGDVFVRHADTYTCTGRGYISLHGYHVPTTTGTVTFPRDCTLVHVEIVGVAG